MCHYYIWCFLLIHWHTFWEFSCWYLLTLMKMLNSTFLYNEKNESESHSVVSISLRARGLYSPWNSPGQNTGIGSLSLLQGFLPTQESNRGFLHGRKILYQLSYQGSPKNSRQLLGHCDSSFALQLLVNWNIKELALPIDTMKNKQLISLIWEKCKPCDLNNSNCKMLLIVRFILIKKC